MNIIDLSRDMYHRMPTYPGQPPMIHGVWKTHQEAFEESGNIHGNAVMHITMSDHAGTHMDAPRHFGMSGVPINEYPLENCIVQGICLDLSHIEPRAEIPPDDLKAAVDAAGVGIPKRGTVLLNTGHHARTFPTRAYTYDNPGVNVAATEWLAAQVHKACLELNITHMESLCNMEQLIGKGEFQFIGLPLKFREGTGSPIRAVAILP